MTDRMDLNMQKAEAAVAAASARWVREKIKEWIEAGELSESSTIADVLARFDHEHEEANKAYNDVVAQLRPARREDRPTPGQYNGLRMLVAGPVEGLRPRDLPSRSVQPMERNGWIEVYRKVPDGGRSEHVFVRITDAGRQALANY